MTTTPGKKGPNPGATTAFLAHRETIAAELAKGWPMTVVHKRYAQHLNDVSYVQFTRYVRRFVRRGEKLHVSDANAAKTPVRQMASEVVPKPIPNNASPPERRTGPIVTPARATKRFIFDPTAAHRRKDELF